MFINFATEYDNKHMKFVTERFKQHVEMFFYQLLIYGKLQQEKDRRNYLYFDVPSIYF